MVSFWRVVRRKNLWLKPATMMRWHTSGKLHAQSADAVVQSFYAVLNSWRERRVLPEGNTIIKTDPKAKPPYRRRRYYRVQWVLRAANRYGALEMGDPHAGGAGLDGHEV